MKGRGALKVASHTNTEEVGVETERTPYEVVVSKAHPD